MPLATDQPKPKRKRRSAPKAVKKIPKISKSPSKPSKPSATHAKVNAAGEPMQGTAVTITTMKKIRQLAAHLQFKTGDRISNAKAIDVAVSAAVKGLK